MKLARDALVYALLHRVHAVKILHIVPLDVCGNTWWHDPDKSFEARQLFLQSTQHEHLALALVLKHGRSLNPDSGGFMSFKEAGLYFDCFHPWPMFVWSSPSQKLGGEWCRRMPSMGYTDKWVEFLFRVRFGFVLKFAFVRFWITYGFILLKIRSVLVRAFFYQISDCNVRIGSLTYFEKKTKTRGALLGHCTLTSW